MSADFDGDRRSDLAVFRPSNGVWYVQRSSTNYSIVSTYAWGQNGDVPITADFDGDRRTDIAVYRPSTGVWYILESSSSFTVWTTPDGRDPTRLYTS